MQTRSSGWQPPHCPNPNCDTRISSRGLEACPRCGLLFADYIEKRKMYLSLFPSPYYIWLRPNIKLSGFVRKDLWDAYQEHAPVPEPPAEQAEK